MTERAKSIIFGLLYALATAAVCILSLLYFLGPEVDG